MKKTSIIALLTAAAALCRADVTNYVYTVSNIYVRTSEVRYVTNRVQNTHYNYYFTNNVTTITNIWTVNHTTNFNYEVVYTNLGPWIAAASNEANRAQSERLLAENNKNIAAGHATTAGSYSSSAHSAAAQTQGYRNQAQTAADVGLSNINARIAWFDEHSGATITIVTTNINMTIDPSANYPHTTAGGTTYENIRYYPVVNENGRVCATPVTDGAATAFCVGINLNRIGNPVGTLFYFDLGYVDSDEAGMRVHYVTRTKELKSCTVSTGTSRLGLPRDFYWQDSRYVAVFDFYDDATNWETRITYRSNSASIYPDNVRGSYNNSGLTWGYTDTFMSKYESSGVTRSPVANYKTDKGSYLNTPTPVWLRDTPTAEQQQTIDWINSFPHQ